MRLHIVTMGGRNLNELMEVKETNLFAFSIFIPIPKKDSAKECSNYHTIALISHASK